MTRTVLCVLDSPGRGSIRSHSPTPRDRTGSVTMTCTALVGLLLNWTVTLNQGNSGNFGARKMTNGAQSLTCNLYLDAARTMIWGTARRAPGM